MEEAKLAWVKLEGATFRLTVRNLSLNATSVRRIVPNAVQNGNWRKKSAVTKESKTDTSEKKNERQVTGSSLIRSAL